MTSVPQSPDTRSELGSASKAVVSPAVQKAVAIQGWMTEGELTFLHALSCSMPPGATVVEVGSWKGRSTVAICEGLVGNIEARLYAVDTFRGTDNSVAMHGRHGAELAEDQIYLDFLANTAAYSFVEVVRDTSVGASAAFADASINWLFLDADHTFEQVRSDIRAWYPKVKPGGIISGHDYAKFDVNRAVDTYLDGVESCETVWHVRRPRKRPRISRASISCRQDPHLATACTRPRATSARIVAARTGRLTFRRA